MVQMMRTGLSRVMSAALALALAIGPAVTVSAAGCAAVAPGDTNREAVTASEYNVDQAISDKAQLNTIAFDGLGFLTGTLGADSFFPPGKVADWWGFQYLRDNDPSEMGHNTDFLTKAALNTYTVLSADQRAELKALASSQVGDINEYGYKRFVLMKAFRRLLGGDIPAGSTGLDAEAVKAYSAELYRLDGRISYERAAVMGPILSELDATQRAYLDAMVGQGMLTWPTVTEPDDMKSLSRDEKVAVMTYAGDLFSWYAGSVDADVYFCPERHGTYFGSFYLKDAPAVGNPGYSIPTTMTGQMGENFLAVLDDSQRATVTGIVPDQKADLLSIVETRRSVATLLRGFQTGSTPSSQTVEDLMTTYGELDGALAYRYATAFAEVGGTLTDSQKTVLAGYRHDMIGDLAPSGAYLFSQEIAMPTVPDTDFLFEVPATAPDPVTSFSAKAQSGAALLSWTSPASGADSVRILRSTASFATTATPTDDQMLVCDTSDDAYRASGLANGTTYYFTAYVKSAAGRWSEAATAIATPRGTTYLYLRASRSSAHHGAPVTLTATVWPQGAAPGRLIRLQRRYRSGWRTVAAKHLTSNRTTFVRRDATSYYFRIQVDPSAKYIAATSGSVRVRRW